jgi:hypothetical protein
MQSSHIPWKLKRHACTDFGSRRDKAIKREMVFRNNYCRNQGGMCYRHNLDRPERWPRSKMGLKDSHNRLANRTLCRCLRPRLAVYLDRHVCLNSLARDS